MINSTVKKIYYGTRYLRMRAVGLKWLFVLGHMRSGSSLLVHLLNSNPEVLGYGETHIEYVGRRSLVQLYDRVHNRFKSNGEDPKKSFNYVMDKILWPRVHNKDILREVPLKIIVILRNPKAALPSILSRNLDGIQTPEEALRYYSKSLKRTSRNLEVYGSPFVIVKYEDLTDKTEKTLKKLYQYLGIKGSLKPEYETMWATGEKGIGDSSENIHSGKIVSSTSSYEMEIEKKVLREARKKYDQFLNSWNVGNK